MKKVLSKEEKFLAGLMCDTMMINGIELEDISKNDILKGMLHSLYGDYTLLPKDSWVEDVKSLRAFLEYLKELIEIRRQDYV